MTNIDFSLINFAYAIPNILVLVVGIFYSIILHEMAHGFAALTVGDDTAKKSNRITLNPIPHIDLLGTVILPIFLAITGMPLFGWAKPVPVNPANFNDKRGMTLVSLAGVAVNLLLSVLFFIAFFLLIKQPAYLDSFMTENRLIYSTIFPSPWMILQIAGINIMLFVFNMLPFPPLDGFNFLVSVLSKKPAAWLLKNRRILTGVFIVLLFTGLFRYIYVPIFTGVIRLFAWIFGFDNLLG